MRIKSILLGCALWMLPALVRAQDVPDRPPLDEAEWHMARGEFPEARAVLQRWRRDNPSNSRVNEDDRARYYFLRGRLTTHADSAEDHYLTVAVNYPTTRYAPDALLRLAQARHARGDSEQAVIYLRRVISDYPSSDQRTMAAIWLVRIEAPRGASNVLMCDLLRNVERGTNPEIIENLKLETDRVCTGRNVAARTPPKTTRQPPPPPRRDTTTRTPVRPATPRDTAIVTKTDTAPTTPSPSVSRPAPAGGRVSVQIGAFRDFERAREVQVQLESAGFTDVRIVRVIGNNLIRVRIGRFVNRAAAEDLLARLAALDISAVLVIDADKEEPVR